MIPEGNSTKLYPFSIKKGVNIYGLIFGAKHPRAVDKFLKIAWDKNKLNGEANFDMDNEEETIQRDLFTDQGQTKVEKHELELEKFILGKEEITNKDLYDFTLEDGHIPKHTVNKVKIMKKEKVIVYDEEYWNSIINFQSFIDNGMIDAEDLNLFDFCSTVDEMYSKIVSYVEEHYLEVSK